MFFYKTKGGTLMLIRIIVPAKISVFMSQLTSGPLQVRGIKETSSTQKQKHSEHAVNMINLVEEDCSLGA